MYFWKIDGKGYIYLGTQAFSTLNLRQWFVPFPTSTDVWIRKYLSMSGFPWTNPSVNSQWHIKELVLFYVWLRVYNHDFGLYLVHLYKLCLEYSGYACRFLFHARLVMCKPARKWYNAHVRQLTVSLYLSKNFQVFEILLFELFFTGFWLLKNL